MYKYKKRMLKVNKLQNTENQHITVTFLRLFHKILLMICEIDDL